MTIRIYVDWSGDPGFKFRHGSSELFVVAAVMSDEEPALTDLRLQLALPEDFEFHYSKTDRVVREYFKKLINNEMEIPGIVVLRVDKQRLPQGIRQKRGEQIMAGFIALCVANLPAELLHNAILYYDGEKEQHSFRSTLRGALSEALGAGVFFRDIKAVPASQLDGLQVADMLAGFIRNDPSSIRSSIVKVIQFPD